MGFERGWRMAVVKDLDKMLGQMSPDLADETYVFATVRVLPRGLEPIMTFSEDEGPTVIVTMAQARQHRLGGEQPMARITLRVHSALDGVGLTAAVSTELAGLGISCNVVAAYHHDHVFLPLKHAQTALQALEALSARHWPDASAPLGAPDDARFG
jgi:uncharacterized protein